MAAPGVSFSDSDGWPKVDVRYLDQEQIEYEISLRNFGPFVQYDAQQKLTEQSLARLNQEIQREPIPDSLKHREYSTPESDVKLKNEEVKICRDGANLLKDLNDPQQILNRAIHLYFRLLRVDYGTHSELELKKTSVYKVLRAHIVETLTLLGLEKTYASARSNPTPITTSVDTENRAGETIPDRPSRQENPLANSTFGHSQTPTTTSIVTVTTDMLYNFPPTYTYSGTIPKSSVYDNIYGNTQTTQYIPIDMRRPWAATMQNTQANYSQAFVTSSQPNYFGSHIRTQVQTPYPSTDTYSQPRISSNVPYVPPSHVPRSINPNITMNQYPHVAHDNSLPYMNRFIPISTSHENVELSSSTYQRTIHQLEEEIGNMRRQMSDSRHNGRDNQSRENTQRHEDTTSLKKLQALPRWNIRFCGDKVDEKNQSIEDYIAAVYSFVDTQHVSETDMISNILPTLNGAARTWFLTVGNKDQLSLRQFFTLLRSRFADKRNKVEIISALCARKFDPKSGYIIEHIDKMIIDTTYLELNDTDRLNMVLKTLPNEARGHAVSSKVKSVDELKNILQQIYPPSVKTDVKEKKTDGKPRRVMKLECETDTETEVENLEEEEEEEEDSEFSQLCHLISKNWNNNSTTKKKIPTSRKPFLPRAKTNVKSDSNSDLKKEPKTIPKTKTEVVLDLAKVIGTKASICFNCRQFGHSHETCETPRVQPFCYKCGMPGEYSAKCPSTVCMERKEKN